MAKEGRLQIPACRRSFGRRSPVAFEGKERRLRRLRAGPLLLAAKFQKGTPQQTFAIDLDETGTAHVLALCAGFRAALRCETLPVGETGGSKGKGDGREGDHPSWQVRSTEGRGYADGGGL